MGYGIIIVEYLLFIHCLYVYYVDIAVIALTSITMYWNSIFMYSIYVSR